MVRATRKLIRRLRVDVVSTARTSTTRLGDWYANLLYKPAQVVLFTSSLTLLPVVVPAKDGKTLLARFGVALSDVLAALRVERTAIEVELSEMSETAWARTTSRQVLGSMNDFAFMLSGYQDPLDGVGASLWLAQSPSSPIGMNSPDDVTREVLSRPILRLADPPR